MKRSLFRGLIPTLCLIVVSATGGHAQAGWDAYLARYHDGLGSVVLNMEASHTAPRRDLPFLLITSITTSACTGDGFPVQREFKRMNRLSDEVHGKLFQFTGGERPAAVFAGTFTHQCQRQDYIYLADTTGIREALRRVGQKRKYASYEFQIRLIEDPEWDAYLKFLYPNDAVRVSMMNHRAIVRMTDAGDALSRPRFVEHLIYFDTIEEREMFIRYIGRMKYDIKEARDMRRDSLRYQVRLAKFGTVSLDEMNDQTTYLSTKAREFRGVYDGWQTKLIGTKQRFRLLYNPIAEPINGAK